MLYVDLPAALHHIRGTPASKNREGGVLFCFFIFFYFYFFWFETPIQMQTNTFIRSTTCAMRDRMPSRLKYSTFALAYPTRNVHHQSGRDSNSCKINATDHIGETTANDGGPGRNSMGRPSANTGREKLPPNYNSTARRLLRRRTIFDPELTSVQDYFYHRSPSDCNYYKLYPFPAT